MPPPPIPLRRLAQRIARPQPEPLAAPQPAPPSALDHPLLPRQQQAPNPNTPVVIPATYNNLYDSPEPGAVVGIVLGCVAAFLIVLWLVYTCLGGDTAAIDIVSTAGTPSVVTLRSRRSRRSDRHHHHHHHREPVRLRATETVEVRTRERVSGGNGGPVIVEASPRTPDRIVVEERRGSRPPPPRVVESDSEDEVVVIEENSPPRRRRSSGGGGGRRSGDYRRDYSRRRS